MCSTAIAIANQEKRSQPAASVKLMILQPCIVPMIQCIVIFRFCAIEMFCGTVQWNAFETSGFFSNVRPELCLSEGNSYSKKKKKSFCRTPLSYCDCVFAKCYIELGEVVSLLSVSMAGV